MSLKRYATRRDANASELVTAAVKMGWWLIPIETPTDFIGAYGGKLVFVEIKAEKGIYTKAQRDFLAEAEYRHIQVLTWRNLHDLSKQTTELLK
jgi:hypothetical protein